MSSKRFFEANHQLNTHMAIEMGDGVVVTVLPENQSRQKPTFSEGELFLIAAYSATTPEEAGEDATWEKYVGA